MESASLAAVLTQSPHLTIALPCTSAAPFSRRHRALPDAESTLRLGSFATGHEQVA